MELYKTIKQAKKFDTRKVNTKCYDSPKRGLCPEEIRKVFTEEVALELILRGE